MKSAVSGIFNKIPKKQNNKRRVPIEAKNTFPENSPNPTTDKALAN